jgi:hypothetical protein
MARVELVAGGRRVTVEDGDLGVAVTAARDLWPLTAGADPDPDRPALSMGFCIAENAGEAFAPGELPDRPLPDPHARKAHP